MSCNVPPRFDRQQRSAPCSQPFDPAAGTGSARPRRSASSLRARAPQSSNKTISTAMKNYDTATEKGDIHASGAIIQLINSYNSIIEM